MAQMNTDFGVDKKEPRIARIARMWVHEGRLYSIDIREIREIRGFWFLNTDSTNNTDIVSLTETWGETKTFCVSRGERKGTTDGTDKHGFWGGQK